MLWSHPAVQDCAVIGVPDDKWGEAVKAVVELKPGCKATAGRADPSRQGQARRREGAQVGRLLAALPRSPVGKVLKKTLREPYWAGRERKI